jgi:hypothetical protein
MAPGVGCRAMLKLISLSVWFGLAAFVSASTAQTSSSSAQNSAAPAGISVIAPTAASVQQFPAILQDKVIAGKTPVGTKIQANLVMATLVNGTVVPRNAILSGEVVESAAKSSSAPSRLSIRIDSAQWKGGSIPLREYLTSWFYPLTPENAPDLQYGPEQSAKKQWNGMGQYPDPNSKSYQPFPAAGQDDGKNASAAPPASVISSSPVAMKNVESERDGEGNIALVSKRSNLKLDKLTTYLFASQDAFTSAAH